MVVRSCGWPASHGDAQADETFSHIPWQPTTTCIHPQHHLTIDCMARRNIDCDTNAAAAFKSALYQGTFGDLNFYVTALKNGVLG